MPALKLLYVKSCVALLAAGTQGRAFARGGRILIDSLNGHIHVSSCTPRTVCVSVTVTIIQIANHADDVLLISRMQTL